VTPEPYDLFCRTSFPPAVIQPVRPRLGQPGAHAQRRGDQRRTRERILPPIAFRQRRHAGDENEKHDKCNAARHARDRSQRAIGEAQSCRLDETGDQRAQHLAQNEYDDQDERECDHVADRR